MEAFWYFIIFIFGLFIGSFLNSIIYRLEEEKSFVSGRSFCPQCKQILSWQDLIPLLSFFVLKGKCRYCKKRISLQYPLVETATAALFLLIAKLQFPIVSYLDVISTTYLFFASAILIVIFVYDLKHFIIPDKVVYAGIFVAFLYRLFEILDQRFISGSDLGISDFKNFINPVLSAIIASAFFLIIILISKGTWMGLGDAKLAFFMGLLLGFPNIVVAFFFAFFLGAIMGLGLIVAKRKTFKSEVPFGPFLTAGTFIALFFGGQIAQWYLQLFLFRP